MPLASGELEALRGINEKLSLREVTQIYLPLSRLLNLHVAATQELHRASGRFLHDPTRKMPFVIAIAGSVAVGKSTTARILQALLGRWPNHPKVDLVTTDGFLYPNRILEKKGLMSRKGFPESYDIRKLVRFVADIKSGHAEVAAPIYSHVTYDIVADRKIRITAPDIVILEGLNVLQTPKPQSGKTSVYLSDFFDFSIYVDANEENIVRWYVERFLTLRRTVFRDNASYFHRFSKLTTQEARQMAKRIWREINGVNLRENIYPTRSRANLVLFKGSGHRVQKVWMRKI